MGGPSMSRWAEMFAALSQGDDTIDTSDTRSGASPEDRACVASVETVETIGRRAVPRRKAAESLENRPKEEPCVACVTSVNGGEQTTPADGPADLSLAHDTSATLATQGRVVDADDLAERAGVIEKGVGVPRAWAEG